MIIVSYMLLLLHNIITDSTDGCQYLL